ncbi:MAG: homoserine dehydrogenase, partial [Methylococcales bacterium]|nr:homoserine dehydrogenase [Methylococcales bacterium]
MKPVKIGILGLGTVGGGAAVVLQRNAAEIARRAGREIIIKSASARFLPKARLCDTSKMELTTDGYDIINDPEIDIIVETIGGA